MRTESLGSARDEEEIRALFERVREGWNRRDAVALAGPFTEEGLLIGFDGSEMKGREEIAASLGAIFADHGPGRWVGTVRSVRFLTPEVALVHLVSGWRMPGASGGSPQAVQTMVAVRTGEGWRIASMQSTPAAYHLRPDLAEALAEELRALAEAEG